MRWLVYLSLVILFLIGISKAIAGPYTSSIHGNTTHGVYRIGLNGTYARGNCAHCHEMHTTPNPFALFANNFNNATLTGPYSQSDDFCFYCHGSPSKQVGGILNYDYSKTFGGATNSTATTILDLFNQASYHDLYDIWNFAQNTFPSFFTALSNPCVACHNPHLVHRSCGKPGGVFDPTQSAISRPTSHDTLWGDNSTERMSNYTGTTLIYQPPMYFNSTNYEPDDASNDRLTQAAKTPDYVSFCTDCHNPYNTIYSHELGRNLKYIDWANEKHGKGAADGTINVHPPFSNASIGKYVLSCLDCHEPHGSPNLFLIRTEVNGKKLRGPITAVTDLGLLCRQCHLDDAAFSGNSLYVNRWCIIHHNELKNCGFTVSNVTDVPYPVTWGCGGCHGTFSTDGCFHCHFHNSTYPDSNGIIRRTF